MSDLLVEAVGVTKSYGHGDRSIEVLRGLDLSVAHDESVAVGAVRPPDGRTRERTGTP